MKILLLTSRFPPQKGGMAHSCQRIYRGLIQRGFSVELLKVITGAVGSGVVLEDSQGCKLPAEIFYSKLSSAENKYRILGFGGDRAGYVASLWGQLLGTHSLVLFRGNDFDQQIYDRKNLSSLQFILDHASVIGGVSQQMCTEISRLRDKSVIFTPNSVVMEDLSLFDSEQNLIREYRTDPLFMEKTLLLMAGHLKAKKGLDLAYSALLHGGLRKNFHLITVGSLTDEMRQKFRKNLLDSWTGTPWTEPETMPLFYGLCDVVLFPSYNDGMPNALLEAMALGRIVIGANIGGIKDVIRDNENGFLFPCGSQKEFIKCLRKARSLTDDQRATMSANAVRTISEEFHSQREMDSILKGLGLV